MTSGHLDIASLARGHKHHLALTVGTAPDLVDLPVIVVRGVRDGKALVVTAGVHGDEYEGVRTIFDVVGELDPGAMTGDLLCVPVANPPAFWAGKRSSPVDGNNLARVFPGAADGTISEQIAFCLGREVIAKADLYLDLHSAGVKIEMPTLIGYDSEDPRGRQAALAFGAPILWGSPYDAPGRTVSLAKDLNIPALYAEARGAGRIDAGDLAVYRRGVVNLLRYLGILAGAPELQPIEWDLEGGGDIDGSISGASRGFLIPKVRLLDRVRRGDELGTIVDLHGNPLETLAADRDGIVVLIHAFPVVEPVEPLFFITGER